MKREQQDIQTGARCSCTGMEPLISMLSWHLRHIHVRSFLNKICFLMGRFSKILSMVSNQALLVSPLAFVNQVIFSLTELPLWDTQCSQTDNSCSLFCQFLGLVPEEQAHRAHIKVETEVSTLRQFPVSDATS